MVQADDARHKVLELAALDDVSAVSILALPCLFEPNTFFDMKLLTSIVTEAAACAGPADDEPGKVQDSHRHVTSCHIITLHLTPLQARTAPSPYPSTRSQTVALLCTANPHPRSAARPRARQNTRNSAKLFCFFGIFASIAIFHTSLRLSGMLCYQKLTQRCIQSLQTRRCS